MLDDLAAIAEQLRAARRDGEAQREMKTKAREQLNRVNTLLTSAIGVLKKLEGQHSANAPINFEQVADKVQEIYNAFMTPGAIVQPDEDAPQPIAAQPAVPPSKPTTLYVYLDGGHRRLALKHDDRGAAEADAAHIAVHGLREVLPNGKVYLYPVHRIHGVEIEPYREA